MGFEFKDKCRFDAVALGEVMLRFDPGDERIRNARNFRVWEGGGEYNVIRSLRKNFGMHTSIITSFADNEIGKLLEDLIDQGGVDTSLIQWQEYDGTGQKCRNGLNFTERGFGVRGSMGCSDRADTAVSKTELKASYIENIFGHLGTRWFHTGGIYAALSAKTMRSAVAAVKSAKRYGSVISYDINYRSSLWKNNGGIEAAQRINEVMAGYSDVLIGDEDDYKYGMGVEDINEIASKYKNIRAAVVMLDDFSSASELEWSVLCCTDGKTYRSRTYHDLKMFDRIGAGDACVSGIIYGFISGKSIQETVDIGAACGAYAMTTPGDSLSVSISEIEAVMDGAGAKVRR